MALMLWFLTYNEIADSSCLRSPFHISISHYPSVMMLLFCAKVINFSREFKELERKEGLFIGFHLQKSRNESF
jgi:hypothetical protein